MGSVWLFGVLQGSQPTSIRQARSGGAGNIRVLLCKRGRSTQTSMQLRHQAVRSHQCARCGPVWSGSISSYTRHQVISYSIGEISSS